MMDNIKRIDLGQNDVLVFSTDQLLSDETINNLRERITQRLSDAGVTNKFLILSAGLSLDVVRKAAA